MMKKVLWIASYEEGTTYLLAPEDIKECYNFGEEPWEVDFTTDKDIDLDWLNEKLAAYKEDHDNNEELEEFFASIGIKANVTGTDFYGDVENYEDKIIYDPNTNKFAFGSYWETVMVYSYWDGHNFKDITNDEMVEYELEVEEDEVNLDEWDGRNMVTGGTGLHQYIQKIIELDGEKVNDKYLLVRWSQWQGSLPSGEIMDLDDVKNHLESIGRDVNEYMTEIAEKLEK
jgi:hypothetical protein